MKIIKLKSENILRLNAVEIEPDGSVVIIGGNNEQGKTSVLDSIVLAMGGRAAKHKRPLRDGADHGEIEIELDDFIVRRTYTQRGTALKVMTKDGGATYSSPQKMLDALVGQLTFDPLAWSQMAPSQQVAILKDMVGLDFSEMDKNRSEVYETRKVLNKQRKAKMAMFDEMPSYDDVPDEHIDAMVLVDELHKRIDHNQRIAREKQELEVRESKVNLMLEERKQLQAQLEALEADIHIAVDDMNEQLKKMNGLIEADTEEISSQIEQCKELNEKVSEKKKRDFLGSEIDQMENEIAGLTLQIQEYDQEKERQLKEAEFPIAGLAFDESDVLYKGVPFSQCSSAEKLRVSVAMGLAMNPDLKVLLIRDGSLLDEKNLKIITDMVTDEGAQIWIERVGKGPECGIIIEDGRILDEA